MCALVGTRPGIADAVISISCKPSNAQCLADMPADCVAPWDAASSEWRGVPQGCVHAPYLRYWQGGQVTVCHLVLDLLPGGRMLQARSGNKPTVLITGVLVPAVVDSKRQR